MAVEPGATVCDGRFVLEERLHGLGDYASWLGRDTEGGAPVLVAIGPAVGDALEELALDVPGVPALLAACDAPGGQTALVQERPPGSIARPDPAEAAALTAEVAAIAAFAHHMGLALGGLRPEAVWRGEDTVTVAPRLTLLWDLGRRGPDGPSAPPSVFVSLERLKGGGPTPADDVFALGATLAQWATGLHPFAGETRREQARAILDRRRRPWTGDPALEPIVAAALAPRERRPSMEALEAALRELG
jgi:hypothetical protein